MSGMKFFEILEYLAECEGLSILLMGVIVMLGVTVGLLKVLD